ncbi:MAG: haloacid dehalogenase-like hydrolase [Polyangia bacterium]|jgi:phosphoglycolate phosphatase-like HAD superfamily hydrolase|nr:haloacid dehalogenase-like hydrolase [Polyangia bacterium]
MIFLFDIDGTLLLSGGAGLLALERAFEELHGVGGAFKAVHPAGMTDPDIVAEAFMTVLRRAPSEGEADALLRRYLEILPGALASSPGFRVLPGVPSALLSLQKRGDLLALATGNIREAARHKLERAGINHLFRCGGFGSDSSSRGRLVGVAAERAASLLGRDLGASEVVVVGDTPSDVQAARQNGFGVVAMASGTVPLESLRDAGPDRIIESLDELLL